MPTTTFPHAGGTDRLAEPFFIIQVARDRSHAEELLADYRRDLAWFWVRLCWPAR